MCELINEEVQQISTFVPSSVFVVVVVVLSWTWRSMNAMIPILDLSSLLSFICLSLKYFLFCNHILHTHTHT